MKKWIITFSCAVALSCLAQAESIAQDNYLEGSSVLVQDELPAINAPVPMQAPGFEVQPQDSFAPQMQDSFMHQPILEAPAALDCGCQQDCCCEPAPRKKRKKRFERVTYQKQVCRLKKVCVTDECGCKKTKLMRVPTTVTRTKLVRVKDPCDPGCLKKVRDRLKGARARLKARLSRSKCDDPCSGASDCGCGCN